MAAHVKSKRQTLKHKYKVKKKVRQHHREVRRANRHKPEVKKINKKDPGIPNLWPFKQQLLEDIERKKAESAETKKLQLLARREALREARESGMDAAMAEVAADAKMRTAQFEAAEEAAGSKINESAHRDANAQDSSKRAFMKEFKKVLESSDVILEVLDARDPLGCRCIEAEKALLTSSRGKRVILVLNKVDLVPREVVDRWLSYLRNDFPTVAFRASLQGGRTKSQAQLGASVAASVNTPECLGASNLISLLKNYCRNRKLKTSIAVGVIGYPNVGKSSLINSLKRSRAVLAGATPGVTRNAQEVHLDKDIRLIDCPGIVFSEQQEGALILRNCIKVETLADPISPIVTIVKRIGREPLMVAYKVPAFETISEFLACLSSCRGKFKKGGAYDVEATARLVLQDWNNGFIPFYTLPPKGPQRSHTGASVVPDYGKEFGGYELKAAERSQLDQLKMSAEIRARITGTTGVLPIEDEELIQSLDAGTVAPMLVPTATDKQDELPTYHVAVREEKDQFNEEMKT